MSVATDVIDQLLRDVQPAQAYLVPILTEIKQRIEAAEQKEAEEREERRKFWYAMAGIEDDPWLDHD